MRIPLPLPMGTANGSMRLCSDAWYRASASSHSMTTTTQHSFERLVPVSIIHVGRRTVRANALALVPRMRLQPLYEHDDSFV